MWRIYKEGQGKWTRGLLAFMVAIGAIFAVASLHNALPVKPRLTVPFFNWSLDYRNLFEAPILIGAVILGVWLFNRPVTADFLIDTENELKNKVTWPSRKEEVNASVVVIITVLIFGVLVFSVDFGLLMVQKLVFGPVNPVKP